MIRKLEITNFRGIRKASIDGLFPLTVFVGRAGQGKSTVLEAAFLLASAPSVRNLHHVARRRGWYGSSTWDFLTPAERTATPRQTLRFEISATVARQGEDESRFVAQGAVSRTRETWLIDRARAEGIQADVQISFSIQGASSGAMRAVVGADGTLATPEVVTEGGPVLNAAVMIDLSSFMRPEIVKDYLSSATREGYLDDALKYVQRVLHGVKDLRLVEMHGVIVPMLYYADGRPSLPVHVAGDGPRRIVELSLVALGGAPGLIIMEEPENFLHPSARAVCTDLLWAAVERREQVIVSTHNLDFIDELLDISGNVPERHEKVGIFRLELVDGQLKSVRIPGDEARDAREILSQDLRV